MFTASTILLMLLYLGVEIVEGADQTDVLNKALADVNLTTDQFTTAETAFDIGYSRGLEGASFGNAQAITGDDGKPLPDFILAIEDGYAYALEARDMACPPPSHLVYQASKSGALKPGQLSAWTKTLDLAKEFRTGVALNVGSGTSATVVPAGTPVRLLNTLVRHGVTTYVVLYNGSALLVPAPDDAPAALVPASTVVTATVVKKASTKKAAAPKLNEDGTTAAPAERGPSLKDAFVYVAEGKDGGPGPLQSNALFAAAVRARCVELGIGPKASTFIQKADRHVPYYLNGYKLVVAENGETSPGRQGVADPLRWVCGAIEHRRHFLKGSNELSFEERLALLPDEVVTLVKAKDDTDRYKADRAAPPEAEKAAKADDDAAAEA